MVFKEEMHDARRLVTEATAHNALSRSDMSSDYFMLGACDVHARAMRS